MSLHLAQLLALCGAIVVYALCREWLFRWWTARPGVAMMDPRQTRGFFNCNPGNMDRGRPPWNGELALGDPRIVTLAPGHDERTASGYHPAV